MKVHELCRALCSGLALHEVPIGYAVKTPFLAPDGDALSFYIRRSPSQAQLLRFEDDGGTIASLEEDGVSLETESRFEAFQAILKQYSANYSEQDHLIHTDYFSEDRIAANFAKFVALMLRVQDLRLFTADRVREIFKDDVRALLQEYFTDKVEILENNAPAPALSDYVADFVLRTQNGKSLAVHAVSTELKALEALLLWQELGRTRAKNINNMAVLSSTSPHEVRRRTLSRLINSGVLLAAMDGTRWDVANKIAGVLEIDPPQASIH